MESLELSELGSQIAEVAKELISFRSTSDNLEQLMECADYIENYFKDSKVFVKRYLHNNVPSLFISLHDTNLPEIIVSSHFDVVPADDHHFIPDFEDNYLLGRGAIDNKGPLAVLMVLIKELSKLDKKPNVALMTSGDEEIGGHNGVKYLLDEQEIGCSFVLVADGGGFNKYVLRAKGLIHLRLISKGVAVHGSRPWHGDNAIENLMESYSRIKQLFKDSNDNEWEKTMNLGMLNGGDAPNKVPHWAEMTLDIRYTEKDDTEELIQEVKDICSTCGNIEVDVVLNEQIFHSSEKDPYFQKLLKASKEILGIKPEIGSDFGSSDARFFPPHGIPGALTVPDGGGSHTKKEYMDLSCIEEYYRILEKFVKDSC